MLSISSRTGAQPLSESLEQITKGLLGPVRKTRAAPTPIIAQMTSEPNGGADEFRRHFLRPGIAIAGKPQLTELVL